MSAEINQQPIKTGTNTAKSISDKEGCLRASYFGCGVLILLMIIIVIFVYFRLDSFFFYGVNHNLQQLQKKLNVERTLTDAQFYEMNNYLKSIGGYLVKEGRTKEALVNFRLVYKAFKDGLSDGRLERGEIATIRSAMLESTIPIIKEKPDTTIPNEDQ